jgi:hypothetical protein
VFVGGVGVGLFIADKYAQWKAQDSANSILDKLHLGGAKGFVDPIVSGLVG